ncbi:MAG: hypothetical protein GC129_07335 [Proteobacteria bacterium]|nr:hypothetical protein [Pseudomonadota bacterium]
MAEGAVVVTGRAQLAQRLADWPGGGGATWAVGFVGAVPSGSELAALKEAARLCDRVVAVVRRNEERGSEVARRVAPGMAEMCREAGADIVWVPKGEKAFVSVDCGVEGVDGTLVAQAVMTVLPMLVVVPRADVALIRALRNIQGGLGEVFSLRITGV